MTVRTVYEDSLILPKSFYTVHPTYMLTLAIWCFKGPSEPENIHHGHFQPWVMSIIRSLFSYY